MPLLRAFYNPPFDTVGEVVDFFQQVFEVRNPIFFGCLSQKQFTGLTIHTPASCRTSVCTFPLQD